ncbi:hypothetical protein ANANG_G00132550 [Anguilla anguilla]|uniref:Uncharacterized protein n=1 Tax=Anguilla anguilla TaxID=7936 RepID=A0A9D3MKU4_ANGAN|nr:hypothetical protein ANANG_G00132550 [Anguilla anguilla]
MKTRLVLTLSKRATLSRPPRLRTSSRRAARPTPFPPLSPSVKAPRLLPFPAHPALKRKAQRRLGQATLSAAVLMETGRVCRLQPDVTAFFR